MEKINISKVSFSSLLSYTFKITFKSAKVYLTAIIFPVLLSILIYLLVTSFGFKDYSNQLGQITKLFIIPFTFSFFTFSLLILNWEASVLVKQSKIFLISRWRIYSSIFLVTCVMTVLSFLTLIICLNLFDLVLRVQNFNNYFISLPKLFFVKGTFAEACGFLFSITLTAVMFFLYLFCILIISYIICNLCKSLVIVQAINFIIVILFLLLGDCIINVNDLSNSNSNIVLNILGYLLPIKSFQWTIVSLLTNTYIYEYNILQTIFNPKLEIPFTFLTNKAELVLPIALFNSFLWIATFWLVAKSLTKKGIK